MLSLSVLQVLCETVSDLRLLDAGEYLTMALPPMTEKKLRAAIALNVGVCVCVCVSRCFPCRAI